MFKDFNPTPQRIIAIAAILVAMLSLVLPWLHIGIYSEQMGMVDVNSVLELVEGLNLEDLAEEFEEEEDRLTAMDTVASSVSKDYKAAKKAIVKVAAALKDSKLSAVETASLCGSMAKFIRLFGKLDPSGLPDALSKSVTLLNVVSMGLWALVLAFLGLGAFCIYAALTGRKVRTIAPACVYFVMFVLYVGFTILVNQQMKEAFSGNYLMELAGFRDYSILRIRFAPILGCLVLAGSIAAGFLLPDQSGSIVMGKVNGGIVSIGRRAVWNCSCGSANPAATRFCPKCGQGRPEESASMAARAAAARNPVWRCACGSVNPEKFGFCAKCGAMRPRESAPAPAPVKTAPAPMPEERTVPRCRLCGATAEPGKTICRSCWTKKRAEMEAASRVSDASSSRVMHSRRVPSEAAPEPGTEAPRVKKGLKPPTTFD